MGVEDSDRSNEFGESPREFLPTRWSLVVAARSDDPERAQAALDELCQRYWYPLYGFARRKGHSREEAEDLTQGFFAQIMRLDTFSRADAEKGKLRTFLLGSLKNYMSNVRESERAVKRGGRVTLVSLDLDWAENQIKIEPAEPGASPEELFDRSWAMATINGAVERLGVYYRDAGKGEMFEVLRPFLTGTGDGGYEAAAGQLGMKVGTVRVAVNRMRGKLRDYLREDVADTMPQGADIEAELREIRAALS